MEWLTRMFSRKRRAPTCDIYVPTQAQLELKREQEELKAAIRLRALDARVDLKTLMVQREHERHADH